MPEDKKILNKGLDALLGDNKKKLRTVKEIEISKITKSRYQPRNNFNKEKLQELSDSISKHGVLSPILVRELGLNQYEVIAGERRLRASKQAKLETIPCLVDQKEDQSALEAALIENLQREDLNAVEEARGYDRLKREFGLTQDEVASATGKARSTIANSLRILSLSQNILEMLADGKIEKGHAKLLASMTKEDAMLAAKKIISNNLSVKELSTLSTKRESLNTKDSKDTDVLNIENEMSESFGHKIVIETKSKKSGRVSILYKTLDELDNIIKKLKK